MKILEEIANSTDQNTKVYVLTPLIYHSTAMGEQTRNAGNICLKSFLASLMVGQGNLAKIIGKISFVNTMEIFKIYSTSLGRLITKPTQEKEAILDSLIYVDKSQDKFESLSQITGLYIMENIVMLYLQKNWTDWKYEHTEKPAHIQNIFKYYISPQKIDVSSIEEIFGHKRKKQNLEMTINAFQAQSTENHGNSGERERKRGFPPVMPPGPMVRAPRHPIPHQRPFNYSHSYKRGKW